MNYLQAFRRSKYTLLFISAVTILIVYMLSHQGFNPLNPVLVPIQASRLPEMTGYQGNTDFKYDRLFQR